MDDKLAEELVSEIKKIRKAIEAFPTGEAFMVKAEHERADNIAESRACEEQVFRGPPRVIQDPDTLPWMKEVDRWVGKNEVDNREELEAFLGINPDGNTGGLPWCAAFMNSVLDACGIKGTGSHMANSFANWGVDVEEADGVIAVFYNDSNTRGHVGFVCKGGTKLIAGNQGDSVKLNNLPYYKGAFEHHVFKWPKEYEKDLG